MSVRDSNIWKVLVAGAAVSVVAACASVTTGSPLAQHEHIAALAAASTGQVRTYYIAADRVLWDYAPISRNDITGKAFTPEEQVFTEQGPNRIGHAYWKSLYRAYTDATFTHRIPTPASCPVTARVCDDTLGFLGPLVRAEVGDTIKIVFRNNAKFAAAVHPHGVFYNKDSEGANYNDGSNGRRQGRRRACHRRHAHLHVGGARARRSDRARRQLRVLDVPLAQRRDPRRRERPHRPDDRHPQGHGAARRIADRRRSRAGRRLHRGGREPQLVRRGEHHDLHHRSDGHVDRSQPVRRHDRARQPGKPGAPELPPDPTAMAGLRAWFKETINGYSYGHTPGLTMEGQRVRWYLWARPTSSSTRRTGTATSSTPTTCAPTSGQLRCPMGMIVADMLPDNPGKWLFHCHVNDHILAGMMERYRVVS